MTNETEGTAECVTCLDHGKIMTVDGPDECPDCNPMANKTEAPERIWAAECRATNSTMWWPDDAGGVGVEYTRADLSDAKDARIAELEAERDELTERVDELQQACEVVSSEFEGELWQSCRRLLQKTQFDFHGADVDGIQADAFESHINETLVGLDHAIARIAELEARNRELALEVMSSNSQAHDAYERQKELKAKLAKALVGLNAMLPAAQQMSNPKMENTIRATIKELKGTE